MVNLEQTQLVTLAHCFQRGQLPLLVDVGPDLIAQPSLTDRAHKVTPGPQGPFPKLAPEGGKLRHQLLARGLLEVIGNVRRAPPGRSPQKQMHMIRFNGHAIHFQLQELAPFE